MRITTEMNMRLLSSAIREHQATQNRIYREMSSGRRVRLASDDPGAYEAIRNLKGDIARLKQYGRNADMANHYLSMADQGLERTTNIMHRANELAVVANDDTLDASTREAIAGQVNELLESLVTIANSKEGGRYTFAGLRTNEVPYEVDRDPATDHITAVRYVGSEETRMIKTGPDMYAATNLAGSTPTGEGGIFQTATRDVFDNLVQLRDVLLADGSLEGTGVPEAMMEDLDHMLAQTSLNGARQEQVRLQKSALLDVQASHMQSLESLESVDMAEATMQLSQAQTAYQAAMYSTSTIMKQASLLNFL